MPEPASPFDPSMPPTSSNTVGATAAQLQPGPQTLTIDSIHHSLDQVSQPFDNVVYDGLACLHIGRRFLLVTVLAGDRRLMVRQLLIAADNEFKTCWNVICLASAVVHVDLH